MRPPADAPRIRDYLRLLARSWIAIICATALSVGAGWLVWKDDRTYYATTRFLVVAPGGAEPLDAYYGNLSGMARTVTYQQLARSRQVTMRTIDDLSLRTMPEELAENITIGVSKSAFLEMQVAGDDPGLTRDTANSVARNMIAVSNEMAAVDTGGTDLVLVDAATEASDKRSAFYRYLAFGGLMGLALSVVLLLAYGLARGSVVNRSQVGHIVAGTLNGKGNR